MAGDEDDRQSRWPDPLHVVEQLVAAHPRQLHVDHEAARGRLAGQEFLGRREAFGVDSLEPYGANERPPQRMMVIDDSDPVVMGGSRRADEVKVRRRRWQWLHRGVRSTVASPPPAGGRSISLCAASARGSVTRNAVPPPSRSKASTPP